MKITYFFTNLGLTGGPMILYNLMNGLSEKGYEVYVVTMYENFRWDKDTYKKFVHNKNKFQNRKFNLQGKILNRILGKNVSSRIALISKLLMRNYEKLNIESDIFVATHVSTADATYRLSNGKKIVMHNLHFEELMFDTYSDRASLRILNYVPFNHIVDCGWLHQMFKRYYGIDAMIINPGLDSSIFKGEVNNDKYSNTDTVRLITYCDPQRKFKGFDQQIAILKKLWDMNKNIEIQIYGNDPKTSLFPYTFLGWVSQDRLAKYYSESHLALIFSWYEAFPLPPIEAMASGCAVVSSKYGTEDYLVDGVTGIIINPFDIDGSARKINEVIGKPDLMSQLAQNGLGVPKNFVWGKQVDKLDQFLQGLKDQDVLDVDEIHRGNLSAFEHIYD